MSPTLSRRMFLPQAADRRRLPVVLLAGFLGSGKTTLVNALLRDARMAETAVAVNEFGEIPLDHQLIDHGADKTLVMANGCLCCNLAGDMEEAVMRLFSRRENGMVSRFARLVIEPSGLADPAPILQAILRNPVMSRALRLEAVVVTVDALHAETQLTRHPEARKQVSLADRLVLTKTDLADAATIARVEALLHGLNPVAPILRATLGAVDAADLFPPSFLDAEGERMPVRSGLIADAGVGAHTQGIAAISLTTDAPLDWRAFEAWLRRVRLGHGEDLLRLKGLVNIAGLPGPVEVHGVHHVLHPPIERARWPDDDRRTRIVLITTAAARPIIAADWHTSLPGMVAAQRVS